MLTGICQVMIFFTRRLFSAYYLLGAYHLLLVLSNGQVAHIPAGQDREWANEALIQLRNAVLGKAGA